MGGGGGYYCFLFLAALEIGKLYAILLLVELNISSYDVYMWGNCLTQEYLPS